MFPTSGKLTALALGFAFLVSACATAPYTGRRQLLLTSEGSETSMGYRAFSQMKRQYPVSRDPELNAMVQRVGSRIAAAAGRPDYRWEFVLFKNDKDANAFCLPGGKVGIMSGILKYARDDAGLATVISHEAGHAIARHAGERLSQSMLAQMGGMGLGLGLGGVNPAAGQAIMQGYSLGTQMGILLPYNRSQEYEADRIGMILMAKAGYDPAAAIDFWKRMMAKEPGSKVPQVLSTHPRDENRIKEMQAFLPQARRYCVAREAPRAPAPPGQAPPGGQYDLEIKPMAADRAAPPSPAPPGPACGKWVPPAR